jgi:hypothetical protein
MDGVRDRLEIHRVDTVTLLQKTTETARLHATVGLADAVSHLARAHALLARELELLADLAETQEEERH